jgi:hypothetical protein
VRDLETIVSQELSALAKANGPYMILEGVGAGYGLVQGGFQTLAAATDRWQELSKLIVAIPLFVFHGTVRVLSFYPGQKERP